jgi:hypothetical protein
VNFICIFDNIYILFVFIFIFEKLNEYGYDFSYRIIPFAPLGPLHYISAHDSSDITDLKLTDSRFQYRKYKITIQESFNISFAIFPFCRNCVTDHGINLVILFYPSHRFMTVFKS